MIIRKSSLVIVFIFTFVFLSINSQAIEVNEPSNAQCYNPLHYNGELGNCSLLFDQNDTTGYIWRQSETWVEITYDWYMTDAEMHTITMDSGEEVIDLPSICLLAEGLKINISNMNSFTCWDGSDWVSFGSGLGGWQPNIFYEMYLDQTPGGNVPNKPDLLGPIDGAVNQPLNSVLQARVSDDNYPVLDVTFYDASDDSILFSFEDIATGSVVEYTWVGLSSNTFYSWYVLATNDESSRNSGTYSFTTGANNAPYLDVRQPDNNLIDTELNVDLSFNVYDDDVGDLIDVTFYDASDDSALVTLNNLASGKSTTFTWAGLSYSTNYQWYATLSDGKDQIQIPNWEFTTKDEPQPSVNPPANNGGNTGGGRSSISNIGTSKIFRNLIDGEKELFKFDNKIYSFRLIEVGDDYIKVTFSNSDNILIININDYVLIDLNQDEVDDIKVTLNEIDGNKVTIKIETDTTEHQSEQSSDGPSKSEDLLGSSAETESEPATPEEPTDVEQPVEESEGIFANLITGAAVFTGSAEEYYSPIKVVVILAAIYLLLRKRLRLFRKILRAVLFRIPRIKAIRERIKYNMKSSKKSIEDYGFRIKGKYGKFKLFFK
jgi:hypothetical protein